ncbi:MAG: DUF2334 domain-containing protein [Ruminococcaceae bacterium]|nr:DUF2334 domain-containing protein [Oscillospiraceae bacterium]
MKSIKKMLCLFLILSMVATMFTVSIATAEEAALDAPAICTWLDNKTAAVSITIDDGVYDSAVRYNELQKTYGIYSTQFIIAGKLKEEEIDGWKDIFADGYMDLGNHSYSHKIKYKETDTYTAEELAEDISGAKEYLETVFTDQEIFCFASPWGQTTDAAITEMAKGHYANRKASGGVLEQATPTNFFKVPTVVVQYGTTLEKLNGSVDTAVSAGGWYVPLLHGIGGSSSAADAYASKYSTIEDHFEYIKAQSDNGNVWSGSFNDVVKYIYERDSATAAIESAEDKKLEISLTDEMEDDELFSHPLTVKVNVSKRWPEEATLKCGNETKTVDVVEENGKKYVYFNMIPDGDPAELSVDELLEEVKVPTISLTINETKTVDVAEQGFISGTVKLAGMPEKEGVVILGFYRNNRMEKAEIIYEGDVSKTKSIDFKVEGVKSFEAKAFVLGKGIQPIAAQSEVSLQKPPIIIFKFDDARLKQKAQTKRLNNAIECLNERGIKGSVGVLTSTIVDVMADPTAYTEQTETYKKWIQDGHEMWLHGYDHAESTVNNKKVYEFQESYDEQKKGLDDSFYLMKTFFNYDFKTFGPSWNTNNDDTVKIINEYYPQIKTVIFGKTNKVAFNALNIPFNQGSASLSNVLLESKTGVVRTYDSFVTKFETLKYDSVVVLQGHPAYWEEDSIVEFKKLLTYLENLGCEFMTPDQYRQSVEQSVEQ